ncbi:MAG: SDR family oxidoreductase [Chloroflexi bacterium]|nr:SDR family oxidoreductase [Chloroflexota bacterium]
MKRFSDKKVVVTGAGQGIGFGICKAFAEEGATVALNDIDATLTQQAADAINTAVGEQRVFPYVGDAALPETVQNLIDASGTPDIVVANAGITKYAGFLECTPDTFDRVVNVNLRGTFFLAQAAALKMIASGKPGRIILMSSVVGLRAFPNFSVYSMTKAAVQMLAKSLALELGSYGITVNAISPGATLTERTQREDPQYAENWASVTISGRPGTVDDIVNAVLFLASPQASQITGHNLVVDGGWTLRSPLPAEHPEKPVTSDDATG